MIYEIIIDINQNEKIATYIIGKPNTSPSILKTKIKGILSTRNNARDKTTNFCSCRFFISTCSY